ncbi:hypothetical protein F4801DRAFT_571514 [Xylaria longipes]|nr:hypothetical protein F4801DRAFT_571514 [Xylaria longipes]
MEQDASTRQQMAQKDKIIAIAMRPKPSTSTSSTLPLQADIATSPYASPLITLHFANGPPLSIPKRLIDKSPKLSSGCGHETTLHLAHIPSGAGHVLVHYLFTGMYECLKPRGASCYENNAADFATGVRVYAVARDYELPELESLARNEIEKLGNRLQVMRIFNVLKNTLPNLSVDDMSLQSYLKSIVRPFIIDSPLSSLGGLPNSADQTLLFANALFKAVIELWRETLSSSLNDLSAIRDRHDGTAVAHVETGPATNLEHNPTNVFESAPDHEGLDMTSKRRKRGKKRKNKKRREAGNKTGLPWDISIERRRSEIQGQKRAQVQHGGVNSSSAALTAKALLNSRARRRLRRLQQYGTANNHTQSEPKPTPKENDLESMSRLESMFGDGFDNAQKSVALDTPSASCDEAVDVPLAIGAEGHFDVHQPSTGFPLFQHIYGQDEYADFSPEELWWKHEL